MVRQSGLVDVQHFVEEQFRSRAGALKVRGVAQELELLVRRSSRPERARLLAEVERLSAATHDLRELALLARLRTGATGLSAGDAAEAERIVGGAGTSVHARLGLTDAADRRDLRERVARRLDHWRGVAESPLSDQTTVQISRTVIRSIEGMASQIPAAHRSHRGVADVMAARGPAQGGR
jgi:hypothetical protein